MGLLRAHGAELGCCVCVFIHVVEKINRLLLIVNPLVHFFSFIFRGPGRVRNLRLRFLWVLVDSLSRGSAKLCNLCPILADREFIGSVGLNTSPAPLLKMPRPCSLPGIECSRTARRKTVQELASTPDLTSAFVRGVGLLNE